MSVGAIGNTPPLNLPTEVKLVANNEGFKDQPNGDFYLRAVDSFCKYPDFMKYSEGNRTVTKQQLISNEDHTFNPAVHNTKIFRLHTVTELDNKKLTETAQMRVDATWLGLECFPYNIPRDGHRD
jgi:hypothetical protein